MKFDEAVNRACEEPTLVDALTWIAIWENDRAVRQALLTNERRRMGVPNASTASHGGDWDSSFKRCFEAVFAAWKASAKPIREDAIDGPLVEVVSAVIIRAGRVLLTQRPYDKDFPLTWESPGGKVDPKESHHAALERELREELGLGVVSIAQEPIWIGDFHGMVQRSERKHVRVHFYEVLTHPTGPERNPEPREGQGIGWFSAAEMKALTLAPANLAAMWHVARLLPAEPSR